MILNFYNCNDYVAEFFLKITAVPAAKKDKRWTAFIRKVIWLPITAGLLIINMTRFKKHRNN